MQHKITVYGNKEKVEEILSSINQKAPEGAALCAESLLRMAAFCKGPRSAAYKLENSLFHLSWLTSEDRREVINAVISN